MTCLSTVPYNLQLARNFPDVFLGALEEVMVHLPSTKFLLKQEERWVGDRITVGRIYSIMIILDVVLRIKSSEKFLIDK